MRPIGFVAGLLIAVSSAGVAQAQSAAAVVSSVTADVTSRVVSEAVNGTVNEALKQDERSGATVAAVQASEAEKAAESRQQ